MHAGRGRGLSKLFISRVIIAVTPFRVLITLLITYLQNPLPLQAGGGQNPGRRARSALNSKIVAGTCTTLKDLILRLPLTPKPIDLCKLPFESDTATGVEDPVKLSFSFVSRCCRMMLLFQSSSGFMVQGLGLTRTPQVKWPLTFRVC